MGDLAVAAPDFDVIGLASEGDDTGPRSRIIGGAVACVGRWGTTKTRIDDVARESGVSRATVYRHFPGGKDEILKAVGVYEEGRFFATLLPALDATETLEDLLVVAISDATGFLDNNGVVGYLAEHEPEILYPHVAFDKCGPLLERVAGTVAPALERFIDPEQVSEIAGWATRLVLSYWLTPGPLDLSDADTARHMVTRYLLPGLVVAGPHDEPRQDPTRNPHTSLEQA